MALMIDKYKLEFIAYRNFHIEKRNKPKDIILYILYNWYVLFNIHLIIIVRLFIAIIMWKKECLLLDCSLFSKCVTP